MKIRFEPKILFRYRAKPQVVQKVEVDRKW
jgi:hypothetical protein